MEAESQGRPQHHPSEGRGVTMAGLAWNSRFGRAGHSSQAPGHRSWSRWGGSPFGSLPAVLMTQSVVWGAGACGLIRNSEPRPASETACEPVPRRDCVDAAVEGLVEVTVASPWCHRRGNRGTEKQAIKDPSGAWI